VRVATPPIKMGFAIRKRSEASAIDYIRSGAAEED